MTKFPDFMFVLISRVSVDTAEGRIYSPYSKVCLTTHQDLAEQRREELAKWLPPSNGVELSVVSIVWARKMGVPRLDERE